MTAEYQSIVYGGEDKAEDGPEYRCKDAAKPARKKI